MSAGEDFLDGPHWTKGIRAPDGAGEGRRGRSNFLVFQRAGRLWSQDGSQIQNQKGHFHAHHPAGTVYLKTQDMELNVNVNVTFQQNKLLSLSGMYGGENISAPEYKSLASLDGAGFHTHEDGTYR